MLYLSRQCPASVSTNIVRQGVNRCAELVDLVFQRFGTRIQILLEIVEIVLNFIEICALEGAARDASRGESARAVKPAARGALASGVMCAAPALESAARGRPSLALHRRARDERASKPAPRVDGEWATPADANVCAP